MSNLVTENGKMYKKVPCYGPDGSIVAFQCVEIPMAPTAPPASLFTESSPVNHVFSEPISDAEEIKSSNFEEIKNELTCENMEVRQKTIEDDEELGGLSDDDAASSTGSSSIDQTETEELDSREEDVKPAPMVFSNLDVFDFDNQLRTLDGRYLTNVDGKYVFEKRDIKRFLHDGKVHRLIFRDMPNKVNRVQEKEVCYKPVYKTVKKIQVRAGPGSKFEATGVLKAQEQIIVLQEGLLNCDLSLVREWMALHLPSSMSYDFGPSKAPTLEDFINLKWRHVYGDDLLEFFSERIYNYDSTKVETFRKAVAAAARKVQVLYFENGVQKTGWISKKKNSGALITRVYGKSTPQVVISGVRTEFRDTDFGHPERHEGTFVPDAIEFFNEHTKTTMFKETDMNGKRTEQSRVSHCKPTMAFFKKLAKSEIASIIGTNKSRFTIDWESTFRSDRFHGLEREMMVVAGKKRMRTGRRIPSKELIVKFQTKKDALTFINADFDDTRFSTASVELDSSFANLHPVDAVLCPEYQIFKAGFAKRSEVGISFITL